MRTYEQRQNAYLLETIRTLWIERYRVRPSYKWCQQLLGLVVAKDVEPYVVVSRFPQPLPSHGPYPYLGWLRSGKPEACEALTLKDGELSYYGWLAQQTIPTGPRGGVPCLSTQTLSGKFSL